MFLRQGFLFVVILLCFAELLWRAPELLADGERTTCTAKGDVYSLAIVLHEIVSRGMPFEIERETITPKGN